MRSKARAPSTTSTLRGRAAATVASGTCGQSNTGAPPSSAVATSLPVPA
jgi:hypothetical protein